MLDRKIDVPRRNFTMEFRNESIHEKSREARPSGRFNNNDADMIKRNNPQ